MKRGDRRAKREGRKGGDLRKKRGWKGVREK